MLNACIEKSLQYSGFEIVLHPFGRNKEGFMEWSMIVFNPVTRKQLITIGVVQRSELADVEFHS